MWQKIKDWFKGVKWVALIENEEVVFFYPLAVFVLLVFADVYNPIKWIALGVWLLILLRNYRGTPLA